MESSRTPAANPSSKANWWRFPIAVVRSPNGVRFEVSWPLLAAQTVIGAATLWLFLALGGFIWIRTAKEFPGVRFVDVALPNRWDQLRVAWGDHFIKLAREEMKAQKWAEAVQHLRYGVARSPGNVEGRLVLSEIFRISNKPDMAEQLLIAGVEHSSDNIEFLRVLFATLLQSQADDEVLKIGQKLLSPQPAGGIREQVVAFATATARFYRGDFDAAEDLIERYNLRSTKDGRLLQIRIEWERGYQDTAMLRLDSLIQELPKEDEFYQEMIRFQRQRGRQSDVERFALLRQLANPQNPLSSIDLMYAYESSKNTDRLRREIDSYIGEFRDNAQALLALADFAANTGNAALAQRVHELTLSRKTGADVTALMWVESLVVSGRYAEGIRLVEQIGQEHPDWFKNRSAVLNGLRSIAHFGLQQRELGALYLKDFLAQRNLRAENLVAVANRLVALQEIDAARKVLESATATDPRNQTALSRLVELDLTTGHSTELVPHLQRLLTMRRPAHTLLQRALEELKSDHYLFAEARPELLESLQATLERSRSSRPPAS